MQSRKMTRGLILHNQEEEVLYYQCNKNKGTDQLRSYREADLCLCFRICKTPAHSQRGSYSVVPQLPKSEILNADPYAEVVSRFVPYLVINPKSRINPGATQIETTQYLQQSHPISKFYNKEGIQQQPEDSIFLTPRITMIDTD